MKYDVRIDGVKHSVALTRRADEPSRLTVTIDGRRIEADAVQVSPGVYSILLNGRSLDVHVEAATDHLQLHTAGHEFCVEIMDPRAWHRDRDERIGLAGRQQVCAPMAGKVVRVLIVPGQYVAAGQGLFVVEAMKMQNEIVSPKAGTVERLSAEEGRAVDAGEVLAVVA